MRATIAVVFALLTAGCGGSWVYQPDLEEPFVKVACDSEKTHTVLQGLNQQVYITEIDGKSTRSFFLTLGPLYPEAAHVKPGRHYLGLMFSQVNSSARGQVWFDAEAGKEYVVRKALKGYRVSFWVEELGSGKIVGGIPGSEPENQAVKPPPGT